MYCIHSIFFPNYIIHINDMLKFCNKKAKNYVPKFVNFVLIVESTEVMKDLGSTTIMEDLQLDCKGPCVDCNQRAALIGAIRKGASV